MADISPFRGLRFNLDRIIDLQAVISPPYDVIQKEEVGLFQSLSKYNMVFLDLPKIETGENRQQAEYSKAHSRLIHWQDEGILKKDKNESIYYYTTQYSKSGGAPLVRKGFISLVKLEDFKARVVLPHEETFSEVVADRFELMKECKAQFSNVFSFFSDPENKIIPAIEKDISDADMSVEDTDGNIHQLFCIKNSELIEQIAAFLKNKQIYIADGHHRYSTSLALKEKLQNEENLSPDIVNFDKIMMYLCPMEDAGLSILPTHRILSYPGKISADEMVAKIHSDMVVHEIFGASREVLLHEMMNLIDEKKSTDSNRNLMICGFYHPGDDRAFVLQYEKTKKNVQKNLVDQLDVRILSEVVVSIGLGLSSQRCEAEGLFAYYSDHNQALDVCVKASVEDSEKTPLLFVLTATQLDEVKNVADCGMYMPHKSTYFYPKLLTGLVINTL